MTWLIGWNRRRPKTIYGGNQVDYQDYQMKLDLHKSSGPDTGTNVYLGINIKDDFSDIRFTLSDGTTLLSHFIESFTSGTTATVCIKMDSIPSYPGKDIYIYYDNPAAVDSSDPTALMFYQDWKTPGWESAQCGILNNLYVRSVDKKLRIQFSSELLQPYVGIAAIRISSSAYIADPRAIEFTLELDNLTSGPKQEHTAFMTISSDPTIIHNDIEGNCAQIPPFHFAFNLYENSTYGFRVFSGSTTITPTSNKSFWRIELLYNKTRVYINGILAYTSNNSILAPISYIYIGMYSSTDVLRYVEFGPIRIYKFTEPTPTWGTSGTEQIYALITATSIIPDRTTCTAPCDVNVDVTWANVGHTTGTFTPSIRVDGNIMTPAQYPPETLASGDSITHTFLVSGLTAASHQICADPDSGTSCTTITVLTPANIIATNIVPNKTTCTAPCDLTVDITWTNNGQTVGTFIPKITVNGTTTALTSESLNFGQYVTKRFIIPGLAAGTYYICSDPNIFPCATINVIVPTSANIISTNMVLIPITCTEPCDTSINVTYSNTGETEGMFIPEIKVDDIPITLISDILGPGENIVKTFSITNISIGTHVICAVPLGTTTCQIMTVERAATGEGGAVIIGLAGIMVLATIARYNVKNKK